MTTLEDMVKTKRDREIRVLTFDDIRKLVGFKGQYVFYRAGFDCLDEKTGEIKDPTRIDVLIPSLRKLSSEGARVVIYAHNGRPKGLVETLKMNAIARYLKSEGVFVKKLDNCFGPDVEREIRAMKPGDITLTENIRLCGSPTANDLLFGGGLFKIYVNGSWPTCQNKDPEMVDVVDGIEYACADPQVILEYGKAMEIIRDPRTPYVVIIGGLKPDKTKFVLEIIKRADFLIPAGTFTNSIAITQGVRIYESVYDKSEETQRMITELFREYHNKLVYPPIDVIATDNLKKPTKWGLYKLERVPAGFTIVGIGPESIAKYKGVIAGAGTVAWAGPFDVYENPDFRAGTEEIGYFLATGTKANVLICGGDTGDAAHEIGFSDALEEVGGTRKVHISTGGGVNLPLLAGKPLPAIEALERNYEKHRRELEKVA